MSTLVSIMPEHFSRHTEVGVKTILLADDEPAVRAVVARMLEAAGYRVISAENGAEASDTAEAYSGDIDVLVSDVLMPGLSGVELAERIQRISPRTKILLISGYAPNGVEFHPDWKFLRKPFNSMVLAAAVGSLLAA